LETRFPGETGRLPDPTPARWEEFLMMSHNPLDNELDLTLFVACYNEEKNIVQTLETVLSALREFDYSWEIIIIDDASRDRSVEVIEEYLAGRAELPIRLVKREYNVGLAQNYIEGAFLGRGKYYRLICGDNVEPRETFVEVFRHLGKADMVLFYQDCTGRTRLRRMLSRMYTALINTISGYRIRYYNGLAVHLRYNVMRWHTNYHGFGFQADLVTRLLDQGFNYIEVPVKAAERTTGASHALTWRNFLSVSHTLLDLFIRRIGRRRPKVRRPARPEPAAQAVAGKV
jgi:glycosyltransferase involved in cell wall biosynthesis